MKKLTADPLVHPDGACNVMHVATDLLAQVRDFVDEGNLRRKEGIGGVLRQLGSFERSNYKRRFD
jgi:hypothetical protein